MIHLVTALQCEARPLVAHFRLKALPQAGGFRVYTGDDICLVVCGIGKSAAAAACGYLQALCGNNTGAAWLNIGIAGHANEQTGDGFLAGRIHDHASGRSAYPVHVVDTDTPQREIKTVDRVETAYAGDWLYEMEASGFWSAASRFSIAELIHCYKIVSDNRNESVGNLTEQRISALIEMQLKTIGQIAAAFNELSLQLAQTQALPTELDRFLERWRFTVTQGHQLERLLTRREAIAAPTPALTEKLASLNSARDVLGALERELTQYPLKLTANA